MGLDGTRIHIGRKSTHNPMCASRSEGLSIIVPNEQYSIEDAIAKATCMHCLDKVVETIRDPRVSSIALKRVRGLRLESAGKN